MMMKTNKAELYNSSLIDEILDSIDPAEANRIEKRMLLAARIGDAMKAKGLNKSQFAELMGKKNSVITKWLSGTHNFTADTLFDISRELDISLIDLDINDSCQSKTYETSISTTALPSEIETFLNSIGNKPLALHYETQIVSQIKNTNQSNYC